MVIPIPQSLHTISSAFILILGLSAPIPLQGQELVPVFGQIVSAEGQPMSNLSVSVRIRSSQRRSRRPSIRMATDAEGRFSLQLKSESSGELQLSPVVPGRFLGWQGTPPATRVTYPLLESGKEYDLGTVVWKPWPVAFAGMVVGPEGAPVPNARLRLRAWRGEGPGHYVTQSTDALGRFTFRGRPGGGLQWAISANTSAQRSREISLRPGQEDRLKLNIAIAAPGGLEGQVRTQDPDLPVEIQVRAESTWSPPGRDPYWRTITIDRPNNPKGLFSLDGLLPGLWDVQVLLDGREVRRLRDLEVHHGATARPKNLQDIVVAENWRTLRVSVHDQRGSALEEALVAFVPDAISGWRLRSTDSKGTACAAYPSKEKVGIRVQARGFRDSVIANPKFPLTLRLQVGCAVRLEFATALPKLQGQAVDTWRLSVVPKPQRSSLPHPTLDLERPLMSDRIFRPYPVAIGAKALDLPGLSPGRWNVHLEARQTQTGANQRFLDLGEFVIPKGANQLVVPLRFTKAQLTRVFGQ